MNNPLALGLIILIAGLVILALHGKAGNALLIIVVWWIGLVLTIVGAVVLLVPPLAWLRAQLLSAIGAGGGP